MVIFNRFFNPPLHGALQPLPPHTLQPLPPYTLQPVLPHTLHDALLLIIHNHYGVLQQPQHDVPLQRHGLPRRDGRYLNDLILTKTLKLKN